MTSADEVDAADGHPLVAAVGSFARDVLRPELLTTDRDGVTADTIARLGDLGALNALSSPTYGGAGLSRAEDRRLNEIIAAGCLNTWLVWAQHAPIPGQLEAGLDGSPPPHELVDGILRGTVFAGAALSDVRHYPERYVRADRAPGGWRFSGTISWVSGWGLNTVLLTAGVDPATDRIVLALVPIGERLRATPLELAAVAGSRTMRVLVDDVFVSDDLVVDIEPLAAWRARDAKTSVDARAHLFGFARGSLEELGRVQDPLVQDLAGSWALEMRDLRERAYALADDSDRDSLIAERLETRADVGEMLTAIARALLVARSGRGIEQSDRAQFFVRTSHFLLVQAQSASVREAELRALGRASRPSRAASNR